MIVERAKEVLRIEAEAISALQERINDDFVQAVHTIDRCRGRFIITGIGKSGHIGKKIAATLTSIGVSSFFLHAAEAIHGDLGMITAEDVVLAISNSGETDEVIRLLPLLKRCNVPLIAMTGRKDSTLAQQSDLHLDISIKTEACPLGIVPTASTTATLAMGDALAMSLLDLRNVTEEDFAQFHPGGSLGKRILLRVKDVMHTGSEIPVVSEDASFSQTVMEMTVKKKGMTVVTKEKNGKHLVTGIVTDGDLRRHINDDNLKTLLAKDIMSANPKRIESHELAVTALRIMEEKKITSLVSLNEEGEIIGLTHLHDLLEQGLI